MSVDKTFPAGDPLCVGFRTFDQVLKYHVIFHVILGDRIMYTILVSLPLLTAESYNYKPDGIH